MNIKVSTFIIVRKNVPDFHPGGQQTTFLPEGYPSKT